MKTVHSDLRGNGLLALLDEATLAALAPRFEAVPLVLRENLYVDGQPMTHVWFPVAGVLSMLAAQSAAESRVEIATIGREGMLGVPLYLGAGISPGLVFPQVEGHGFRMRADDFLLAVARHPSLASAMQRYTYVLLVQLGQGMACNRVHDAEQRCARWLLQTHDRVHGNDFDLTQEFLAEMLGERRATVNQAASSLQQRGLIRYSRGHIEITDRTGLEGAACPCYGFLRGEHARMLAPLTA